jgi:hypothetical protein
MNVRMMFPLVAGIKAGWLRDGKRKGKGEGRAMALRWPANRIGRQRRDN